MCMSQHTIDIYSVLARFIGFKPNGNDDGFSVAEESPLYKDYLVNNIDTLSIGEFVKNGMQHHVVDVADLDFFHDQFLTNYVVAKCLADPLHSLYDWIVPIDSMNSLEATCRAAVKFIHFSNHGNYFIEDTRLGLGELNAAWLRCFASPNSLPANWWGLSGLERDEFLIANVSDAPRNTWDHVIAEAESMLGDEGVTYYVVGGKGAEVVAGIKGAEEVSFLDKIPIDFKLLKIYPSAHPVRVFNAVFGDTSGSVISQSVYDGMVKRCFAKGFSCSEIFSEIS